VSGQTRRLAALRAVACLALLAYVLLAPRLFLSARAVPLVPALPAWPALPPPLDRLVLFALVGSLLGAALSSRLLTPALLLCAFLALGDQNRWQPWYFQSVGLIAAARVGHAGKAGLGLDLARLVVVATEFYAGLHKFTPEFVADVAPWLIGPWRGGLGEGRIERILAWAWLAPWLEMALGAGLLLPSLRRFAAGAALAVHALLVVAFGPTGHGFPVIALWNVEMVLLVALLFLGAPNVTARTVLWPARSAVARCFLLLFGILPLLHVFDAHDAYLSANLYTGNVNEAALLIPPVAWGRLDEDVRRHAVEAEGGYHLDLYRWGMADMNAPVYPETRVALAVASEMAARAGPGTDVAVVVRGRRHSGGRPTFTYRVLAPPVPH
jgi:hypothetical protein